MRLFLTLFFLSLNLAVAKAQATASFTASATIIQPICIETTSNFNFAVIEAQTGGEVILAPQGERTSAGNSIIRQLLYYRKSSDR